MNKCNLEETRVYAKFLGHKLEAPNWSADMKAGVYCVPPPPHTHVHTYICICISVFYFIIDGLALGFFFFYGSSIFCMQVIIDLL